MPEYTDSPKDDATKKPDSKVPTGAEAERIIKESEKRFALCEEAERALRELALDDLKFRAGEQWDDDIKRKRIAKKKPCLTLNYLPTREKQVLNEQRQNRSAIKVNPVDGKADPDTADIFGGIIRHVEYDSNGDDIWDTALASATRIGFGFLGVITEFENPTSFQQVIKMRGFRNPFQVYLDANAQKPDRSDAKYGHIFETYTKEEYEFEFPDSELCSLDDWGRTGNHDPGWLSKDAVRIAEYFYTEYTDDNLLLIRNRAGEERTIRETEFEKLSKGARRLVKVIDQRETKIPEIRWCKHNALEVLSSTEWPGQWIPIIPILGDELDVDGQLILEGMVRHVKDAMRMQNYMASAEVQAIALAPKAPIKAPSETYGKYKHIYDNANNEDFAVLPYETYDSTGRQIPEPQRDVAEPPIAAITQARLHFADDFRQITGIHEAQYGAPSNEKSGKAIAQRRAQGELSNFHYVDNCTRARRFLGRQLLDLIPKIYSGPQMIRIIGEDGAQKVIRVNQEFQQGDGSTKKYDLGIGRYDVTISNQPSYQTRRQEAADNMLQLANATPQLMQIAPDIVVGMMDFPEHEKLAERLKKTLPPGLADDPTDTDPKAQLQQANSKLQALSQQHEQLTKALEHEIKLRETKQVEMDSKKDIELAKIQSQTQIETMRLENQRAIAEIGAKSQDARERMKLDYDLDKQMHVSAHEMGMQADQQLHAKELADQQAQAQQAQQAQAQDFQAQQAQQQQQEQQPTQ